MDDKMKIIINKFLSEKEKKSKSLDKIKQLEILLVKVKYANNPNILQSALKDLKKV